MARRSAWTHAKSRKLKSMCRDGRLTVTLREAADTLGFSYKAVQVKLHGFGLVAMNAQGESANGPRTNAFAWTGHNTGVLLSMCGEGRMAVSNAAAAERLGCTVPTLQKKLAQLGMRERDPKRFAWSLEQVALLESVCQDGMLTLKIEAAARLIGCERTAIIDKLKLLGLRAAGRRVFHGARLRQLQMLIADDGTLLRTEQEVADAFRCSWKTVRKAVKAEIRRRRKSREQTRP